MVTQAQVDEINKVLQGKISADKAKQNAIALDPNSNVSKRKRRGGSSPSTNLTVNTQGEIISTTSSEQVRTVDSSAKDVAAAIDAGGSLSGSRVTGQMLADQQRNGYKFVRQGDYFYRINTQTGSFESVATVPDELMRRKRLLAGEGTAGDVYGSVKSVTGINPEGSKNPFIMGSIASRAANAEQARQEVRKRQAMVLGDNQNGIRTNSIRSGDSDRSVTETVSNNNGNIFLDSPFNFRSTQERLGVGTVQTPQPSTEDYSLKQSVLKVFPPMTKGVLEQFQVSISDYQKDNLSFKTIGKGLASQGVVALRVGQGVLESTGILPVSRELYKAVTLKQTFTEAFDNIFKGFGTAVAHPVKTTQAIVSKVNVLEDPFTIAEGLGETVGLIKGPEFLKTAGKTAKSRYIETGSEFVEPSKIFDAKVLSGETVFPESRNIREALKSFEQGRTAEGVDVVHVSAKQIKGDTIGAGPAGRALLEDPGLYVAPKKRGSAYFTGITPDSSSVEVSFNPINALQDAFATPTVTTIKVSDIVQYPRSVIEKPGFKSIADFQREQLSSKGVAVITKRSELGYGNIVDRTVKSTTTETEAVIPIGTKYRNINTGRNWFSRLKGYGEYTTYNGENVALRQVEVLKIKDIKAAKVKFLDLTSESTIERGTRASESVRRGKKSSSTYSNYLKSEVSSKPSSRMLSDISSAKYLVSDNSRTKSKKSSEYNFVNRDVSRPAEYKPDLSILRSVRETRRPKYMPTYRPSGGSSPVYGGRSSDSILAPPVTEFNPKKKQPQEQFEQKQNNKPNKNSFKYTADAYSALFNIKARLPRSKLDKKTFSGFETRGIIESKRKKKSLFEV